MNIVILIFHISVVAGLNLVFLRIGKEAMVAWLALLIVLANLFIHKQISLFGLNVTCSDALAVGYLLGSNLFQEFFGKKAAMKTIWISFGVSASVLILSYFQLAYHPSSHDYAHPHFTFLLTPLLRVTAASLFAFLCTQLLDLYFFSYIRQKTEGRFLTLRILISAIFGHCIDTVLFSFLALYGRVESIGDILLFSFMVKLFVVAITLPFTALSKKVIPYDIQVRNSS